MSGEAPVLEIRDVSLRFGGLEALRDVNLTLHRQEIHGVVGPNGAGKTSTFDVITGVYRPVKGAVTLEGVDITRWPAHRRTRAGLARSFQTVGLAPGLTARENVIATIEALERQKSPLARPSVSRRRRGEADELLSFFGLTDDADVQVTDLPLGTTKLVELAKVFAGSPKVVLLDEPFAGLSTHEAVPRVELIAARRSQCDCGVIIVEHDVPLLLKSCDTLTVLDAGEVVTSGDPQTVMADPAVRAAYMGELVAESVT